MTSASMSWRALLLVAARWLTWCEATAAAGGCGYGYVCSQDDGEAAVCVVLSQLHHLALCVCVCWGWLRYALWAKDVVAAGL
jgi:hypothetical protein